MVHQSPMYTLCSSVFNQDVHSLQKGSLEEGFLGAIMARITEF